MKVRGVAKRSINAGIAFSGLFTGAMIIGVPMSAHGIEQDKSRVIEEIIVTSRRTEESQQDVPLAVTSFTSEDIARVGPRTLRDFDGLAPNVRIGMNTAGPSAGAIFIRGIGYADIEKTQSPAVGVIIDGVQQGSSTGQLIDTFDVAQIEINRGPQGVLQGKNTTGGAIVVHRVRPEFNELGWAISAQGGNYDEAQFKGRLNIPLVDDTLALKVGYINKQRDGYFDNITRGGSAGDIDYQAITVALRWEPTDAFDALLTYDYIQDRGDIPPQDPRYNGENPFKNEANFAEFQEYDVDGLTLNLNWDVGFGVISSTTGWQQADDRVGQDFDGSTRFVIANPLVQLHTLREQEYEQFSQEIKLVGNINDNLHYVVGGFYWETDLEFAQGTNQIVQIPGFPGFACPVFGGIIGIPLIDNPNPAIGSAFCQFPTQYTDHRASEKVESRALFGALTWDVTEQFELSAGVRWLDEDKDFQTQFGLRAPPGGPVDALGDPISPPTQPISVFPGFPVRNSDSWSDTVFTLSGKWQFRDENQIYASYSQGFRSGGFSIRGTDPDRLAFEPENVETIELGSKNEFFGGRLRVNLAAFVTVLEDAQFSSILTIPEPPGTNTLILNATEDFNSKGIEAEVIWAATDELSFIATIGVQDTEGDGDTHSCLDRPFNPDGTACNPTSNPDLFAPGAGPLPNVVNTGGTQGFAASDYNWALAASYDKMFGGNEFHAGIILRETDEVYLSADTTGAPIYQPDYMLVDIQISYRWNLDNNDVVKLAFYGKNITDEEYVEQELVLGEQGGFKGWGPPATYALELQWTH